MKRRAFLGGFLPVTAWMGFGGTPSLGSRWPVPPTTAEFIDAVLAGDEGRVRSMLRADPSLVYARDARGRSAFVLAHLHHHFEVATALLDQGFVMDQVEAVLARDWDRLEELAATSYQIVNLDHPIGGTAMYAGAVSGLGADMWRVQQYGGDPNANPRGPDGLTPARIAVEHRVPLTALATTATLLGNGGGANTPQRASSSILHGAAATGDPDLTRLVLRKGGDPDAVDDQGRTPADVARSAGHEDVVRLLETHEQVRRDHRSSRFAYAADGTAFSQHDLSGYDARLVDRTVGAAHFNVDATRDTTNRFPELAHAISASDEAAVEACAHTGQQGVIGLLLERGAPYSLPTALAMNDLAWADRLLTEDPRRVDERGAHDFAVMWYPAIGGGSVEAASLLLERGADLEQEYLGTTALHFAARSGQADLVAFLLERGAEVNAVGRKFDMAGETPLDHAVDRDEEGVAQQLRAAGGVRASAL